MEIMQPESITNFLPPKSRNDRRDHNNTQVSCGCCISFVVDNGKLTSNIFSRSWDDWTILKLQCGKLTLSAEVKMICFNNSFGMRFGLNFAMTDMMWWCLHLLVIPFQEHVATPLHHQDLCRCAMCTTHGAFLGSLAKNHQLVTDHNYLVLRCFDTMDLCLELGLDFLFEHPEDLGKTSTGEQPASVWQLEKMKQFVQAGAITFAIYQCHHRSQHVS